MLIQPIDSPENLVYIEHVKHEATLDMLNIATRMLDEVKAGTITDNDAILYQIQIEAKSALIREAREAINVYTESLEYQDHLVREFVKGTPLEGTI